MALLDKSAQLNFYDNLQHISLWIRFSLSYHCSKFFFQDEKVSFFFSKKKLAMEWGIMQSAHYVSTSLEIPFQFLYTSLVNWMSLMSLYTSSSRQKIKQWIIRPFHFFQTRSFVHEIPKFNETNDLIIPPFPYTSQYI